MPYRGSSRPLPVPHLQNCALEPLKQRLCEAPSENRRAALLASRCAHATGARAGDRGHLQDTAGGPAELVSPTPHLAPALGDIRAIPNAPCNDAICHSRSMAGRRIMIYA